MGNYDRETLIRLGWTPPPEEPEYEAWRPALIAFRQAHGSVKELYPSTPLDGTDKRAIDALRAAFAVAPKDAR